jgi:predicted Zn finger-like uncharacterized protein
MSIKTSCPNCEATYTLAESQRGKKVRCRECSNTFVVGGQDDAPAPRSGKLRKDGVGTAPRAPSRTPPPRTKPAAVRRDRDREDEDDEENETTRQPDVKKKGSALPMILLIGGGILLLFLLCGGAAIIGVYWWTSTTVSNGIDNIAQNIQNNIPQDPNAGNPFGQPIFNVPNEPKDVTEAIAFVRNGETADKQNRAADWLAKATPDDARQKEVVQAVQPLLKNANTHDAGLRALANWAGPNECPQLLTELDTGRGVWGSDAGDRIADTLIKQQYAPASAVFARKLTDFFQHDRAKDWLSRMGSVAEKEVLKHMDSKDGHDAAMDLLRGYGTKPETMFNQALADLKSPDSDFERNAADYVAKCPVDQAKRTDVAKSLESALSDRNNETRKAAAVALKTWGTKDNAPALIAELDRKDDPFGGTFEACANALAKLKDEKGAEAIAAHLPDFGGNRDSAVRALREMGPIAEKAVAAYVNHRDQGVREEAERLLKGYNTKEDVKFDAMIADLSAKDAGQRKGACDYLADHAVDAAHQKTVARGLEKLLDDTDPFAGVPDAAAKALGVWGDKDSVAVLIAAMTKKDSRCWQPCVDALVKLKDERAVYPLLVATQDFFHKDAAVKALNDMGPLVETALDNALIDPSATVGDKLVICAFLGQSVGTKTSLAALQQASMDANSKVKNAALGAISAIKKRNP